MQLFQNGDGDNWDISKLANEIHKQKKERKTKKPNTQGWKFPKIQGGGLL